MDLIVEEFSFISISILVSKLTISMSYSVFVLASVDATISIGLSCFTTNLTIYELTIDNRFIFMIHKLSLAVEHIIFEFTLIRNLFIFIFTFSGFLALLVVTSVC